MIYFYISAGRFFDQHFFLIKTILQNKCSNIIMALCNEALHLERRKNAFEVA